MGVDWCGHEKAPGVTGGTHTCEVSSLSAAIRTARTS